MHERVRFEGFLGRYEFVTWVHGELAPGYERVDAVDPNLVRAMLGRLTPLARLDPLLETLDLGIGHFDREARLERLVTMIVQGRIWVLRKRVIPMASEAIGYSEPLEYEPVENEIDEGFGVLALLEIEAPPDLLGELEIEPPWLAEGGLEIEGPWASGGELEIEPPPDLDGEPEHEAPVSIEPLIEVEHETQRTG